MNTENFTLQTPENEPVTPIRIQSPQPTNGVLRRHMPIHIQHFRHPVVVTYKECLKNFNASNGGHIIDGCCEFLLASSTNLSNPRSLHCEVCGCHRNFHRRVEDYSFTQPLVARNSHVHSVRNTQDSSDGSLPTLSSFGPHMLMALSHGLGSGTVPTNPNTSVGVGVSGKRFRTKITEDQKGKMLELAEKVGWKSQKRNDFLLDESCREIGVEKRVFKVWMHNNKKIVGKKETLIADVGNGVGLREGSLGNGVCSSGGNWGNDVGLNDGDLGNRDHVQVEEKGCEENVVVDTNDGSSPSATA